ncbi:hypothetical protein [Micromonospora musae]|uniref:Spread protein n=1 Tax=Micromonospora musae TaxID=1894970 RepID=A0A3A9XP58_9ACTN|nr:hypothetical protein [Micromonospora musae]RKN26938.1 hypothetical protein D7044_29370 [Micromonospora musae]
MTTPSFYRLRAPNPDGSTSTAVSVRVDPERPDPYPVYLAVGGGRRRMYLTPDEAWALWRCLSEAVATLGEPPDHIRTRVNPARR